MLNVGERGDQVKEASLLFFSSLPNRQHSIHIGGKGPRSSQRLASRTEDGTTRRAPGPGVHWIPRRRSVPGQLRTRARFPRRRKDSAERLSRPRGQTRLQGRREEGRTLWEKRPSRAGWRPPWSWQFPNGEGEGETVNWLTGPSVVRLGYCSASK